MQRHSCPEERGVVEISNLRQEGKVDLRALYENCSLCPRQCGINRSVGNRGRRTGFCGETDVVRVAYVGAHFGEEPPLTGTNGSGTVFFSGCSLRCAFCQNRQISHDSCGDRLNMASLRSRVQEMVRSEKTHNINFVTPDHFFPHVFQLVSSLRRTGHDLPMVYNLSGYQSVDLLRMAKEYADIYLPDFKYADRGLAASLSRAADYPDVALEALAEMVRQKGFLDACVEDRQLATRGVLVRHLILPGQVRNSVDTLTTLRVEFGPELPLSLMSQYHPVGRTLKGPLKRFVKREEFDAVYAHVRELGFRNLFIQFPTERKEGPSNVRSPFLPDFRKNRPFGDGGHKAMHPPVDRKKAVC
jgi:putative pyruvate formate lyase activating enzyme